LDITDTHFLKTMIDHFHKQGTEVIFKNVNEQMHNALRRFGVLDHGARIEP